MLKTLRKKLLNPVLNQITDFDKKIDFLLNQCAKQNAILKELVDKLPNIKENDNSVIELGNIQIVDINLEDIAFFWIIDRNADDPISNSARLKVIPIEQDLLKLFKRSGTFLDLGANIGTFSLTFGAMGWDGYSFEASSRNYNLLCKSICLNSFNIKLINKAVYNKTGSIYFGQDGPYGTVKNEIKQGLLWEEIPCICLDDWYEQEKNLPVKIDFIKIDIEGSEVAALQGAKKMLEMYSYPPIFIESNSHTLFFHNETQKSLLTTAKEIGYNAYILKGNKLIKYDSDMFPTEICFDLLLLHDMPENIIITDIETSNQIYDEMVEQILIGLTRFLEKNSYADAYICYALKDYPNYVRNNKIKAKLEDIRLKNFEDEFLNKYIKWFE